MSRSLMIGAAAAVAGVAPCRRVGGGGDAIGAAVAHPAVHARTALTAPVVLSFVAQACSLENLCATRHRSTATPSLRYKKILVPAAAEP